MKANKTNNDSWVAKTFDSEGLVSYATFCSCGNHDLAMQLNYDKEDGIKDITFYTTGVTWEDDYRNEYSFFERIKIRIKTAWRVLTKGYIEQEAVFVFHGDEQIKDLGKKILELSEIKVIPFLKNISDKEDVFYRPFESRKHAPKPVKVQEDASTPNKVTSDLKNAYKSPPKGVDTNKPTPSAPKHKNEVTVRIIDETTKEVK